MRTGIFGGSFNPIHNAHISLARRLLTVARLDEIWFVVSPQNPFKRPEGLMSDEVRMALTRKALENEKGLVASDYEMHLPKPSYMWNTLQGMSRDYPDREFSLIIGSDNWLRFDEWYHADEIKANYKIIIYPRPGYPIDSEQLPAGVTLVDTPMMDISSTEIRKRLKNGESISHLVPASVNDMLKTL